MAFNPNEHLMKLKMGQGAQDYLPVQWRLVWFRELCPQGTIDTEELEYDSEREVEAEVYVWNAEKRRSEKVLKHSKGYARYRAIVTDGKGGRATGTKSENAANFADYGEKAETGSIGRALAALGYGTQFTGDELNEGHRIVDSPVDRHNETEAHHDVASTASQNGAKITQVNNNGNHASTANKPAVVASQSQNTSDATEQQRASIRKLCEHLGQVEPVVASFDEAKGWIAKLSQAYRESRKAS
jgi:hypothetical protein